MNIELFSCAGGMAEGFRRAGLTFDLVVDKSANAVESYTQNLGHRPVRMDVHDFERLIDLGFAPLHYPESEVHLLVADPPCTPWSTAGNRQGLDDPNDCLLVTVRLIQKLRPRAYLIGNVPGLETEPNLRVVQEVIGSLADQGYCTADFAKLDAASYGVPQHRVRPFWFGHLDGPCLRWPERTHGPPAKPRQRDQSTVPLDGMGLPPYVTVRDALGHLPLEQIGRPVSLRRRGGKRAGSKPRGSAVDEPAHVVTTRAHSGDGGIIYVSSLNENKKHPPMDPDEPATTIATKPRGNGSSTIQGWDWMAERPSTTVMAGNATIGGPGKGSICTRPKALVITELAATILQGFPEDWHFAGKTKSERWVQIGQAMPPALAEAVARSIMDRSEVP